MKKTVVFVSMFLFAFALHAQNKVFEYSADGTNDKKNIAVLQSLVIPASNNNIGLVLKKQEKVEYIQLDSNFKILQQFTVDLPTENALQTASASLMGSAFNNNAYLAYYLKKIATRKSENAIYERKIDFTTKAITEKLIAEIPKEEAIVGYLKDVYHRTFLIAANDKTKEMILYYISPTGEFVRKSFLLSSIQERRKKKIEASEYLSDAFYINPTLPYDFVDMRKLTKIYTDENRFILLLNDANEASQLITVSLKDFSIAFRNFPFTGFDDLGRNPDYGTNSVIIDAKLFVVRAHKSRAEIGVFDFESGKLLRKFNISEKEQPIYTYKPYNVERRGNTTKADNPYDNIKDYLKDVYINYTSIAVHKNETGHYVIEVGGYDNTVINVARDPGYVDLKGRSVPGSKSSAWTYRSYTAGVSRFALDPVSLENVKAKDIENYNDKLEKFLKTRERTEASIRFNAFRKSFFGAYEPGKKIYVIHEITAKELK